MNIIIINLVVPLSIAVAPLVARYIARIFDQLARLLAARMLIQHSKELTNEKVESICNMMSRKQHLSKKDS